jgi:hypothetical protein
MAAPTSIKQRFVVTNIGLLDQPNIVQGVTSTGVRVTLWPLPDGKGPATASAPVDIPFLGSDAGQFFSVGQTIDIVATAAKQGE